MRNLEYLKKYQFKKGHIVTKEMKRKISENRKGKGLGHTHGFKKGDIPWNKNKKGIMPVPWNKGKKTGAVPWNKGVKGIHLSPKSEFKPKFNIPKDKLEKLYWIKKYSLSKITKIFGLKTPGSLYRWVKKYNMKTRNHEESALKWRKHPNWKGGYEPYYGPNWNSQKRKCLKRDNYTCQICSNTKHLHVHHKIPFRIFALKRYREANSLKNLITLCNSCHSKIQFTFSLDNKVPLE